MLGHNMNLIFVIAASFFLLQVTDAFQSLSFRRPGSMPGSLRIHVSPLFFKQQCNPKSCPVEPDDTIEELQKVAPDKYIDSVIDQITGYTGGPIMLKYKPGRRWLWGRWRGTLLQHGCRKAVINMLACAIISFMLYRITGGVKAFGSCSAPSDLASRLKVFDKLWHYCLTLTTFILTFFVTQAYSFWRNMYSLGRKIQGRLNDINLLLAAHTKRDARDKYTEEGAAVLDEVAGYLRIFSPLLWASQSRCLRVLLTERGLYRMVERGYIPRNQVDTLLQLNLPRNQLHNACLEWALIRIIKAQNDGILNSGDGFDSIVLQKFCDLRATYGSIGDQVAGRMPLVYAHFVQVLLDFFLFGAPFALYTELGSMSIACVGLFTLFYEGLFDLAKVFLDPLENEDYCDGGIEMDLSVLIRESNAGSIRWKNGAAVLPSEETQVSSLEFQ